MTDDLPSPILGERRFDAPRAGSATGSPRTVGWPAVLAGMLLAAFVACVCCALALGVDAGDRAIADAAGRVAVRIVLSPSAPAANASDLATRLGALPGVSGVRVVARDDAWRTMQSSWPAAGGANPLPDVLLVTLKPSTAPTSLVAVADAVRQSATSADGVDAVRVDRDWLARVDRARDAALAWRTPLLAVACGATLGSSWLIWWLVAGRATTNVASAGRRRSGYLVAVAQALAWAVGAAIAYALMQSFGPASLYPGGVSVSQLDRDVVATLVAGAGTSIVVAAIAGFLTDRKIASSNRSSIT